MALDLKGKIGPLPVWGWGVAIVGLAGGYFYMRSRSAASSTTATDGTDTSGMDSTGYQADTSGIGYDSSSYGAGYAAGVNANGSQEPLPAPVSASGGGSGSNPGQGGTNATAAHNRFCAKTRDPSGKMVTACGYGTWIKGKGGQWRWQPGIPPGNGVGGGASGKITLPKTSAPAATAAAAPAPGITGTPSDVSANNPLYAVV